jgi:hypothetical protein
MNTFIIGRGKNNECLKEGESNANYCIDSAEICLKDDQCINFTFNGPEHVVGK